MKNVPSYIFVILTFIAVTAGTAQRTGSFSGTINGDLVDSLDQTGLAYANILLYSSKNGRFISGTTSNDRGSFVFRDVGPGIYYIEIKYIGYHDRRINGISIRPDHHHSDLGKIYLKRSVLHAEEVEVIADRLPVKYEIDKKIINVSKDYSSISGSAVDILENVPSMSVDIEGNVLLRGSSSFTVLIDNRPTALDPNDALQQIPAATIENIEIITNPSAKYDPDGVSGIVNIITRKRMIEGISGIANTNGGLDNKYGADFLFGYRNGFGGFSLGINYDLKTYPGTEYSENSYSNGATLTSDGNSTWQRRRMGLNGEAQLYLSPRDNLILGFRTGNFRMANESDWLFSNYMPSLNTAETYGSNTARSREGNMVLGSINYIHTFPTEAELDLQTNIAYRSGDERTENRLLDDHHETISGQISIENGPASWIRYDLNYAHPFENRGKFEIGYQGRITGSSDRTSTLFYDSLSTDFIENPLLRYQISYYRNTQAVFGTVSGEFGPFGLQAGLRSEYTGRKIESGDSTSIFTLDRWDFFPSIHTSLAINDQLSMMASYSRRIDRPRGWYFEPFITWSDAYNARKGNPELLPEYIDAYEAGVQVPFRRNSISIEAYHRKTHNLIERIREHYRDDILLHSVANVGEGRSSGIEMMLVLRELDWWEINLTGNLYKFNIEGTLNGEAFGRSSDNWNVRLNNTFKIGTGTRIQITGNYRSPSSIAQGSEAGYYTTNLGIRQMFLNRKLSATLQVRDVLGTWVREYRVEGVGFESYSQRIRKAPVVLLTLTYNFNNFRNRERSRNGSDGGEGFDEEF